MSPGEGKVCWSAPGAVVGVGVGVEVNVAVGVCIGAAEGGAEVGPTVGEGRRSSEARVGLGVGLGVAAGVGDSARPVVAVGDASPHAASAMANAMAAGANVVRLLIAWGVYALLAYWPLTGPGEGVWADVKVAARRIQIA